MGFREEDVVQISHTIRGNQIDLRCIRRKSRRRALPGYIPQSLGIALLKEELVPHSVNDMWACKVTCDNGESSTVWCSNGMPHRKRHPAMIYELCGSHQILQYMENGKKHRQDGPAFVSDSLQSWHLFGKIHRYDGPAKEMKSQNKYVLHGIEIGKKAFSGLSNKPIDKTLSFLRRLNDFSDNAEQRREAIRHAVKCLKLYGADVSIIQSMEAAALLV